MKGWELNQETAGEIHEEGMSTQKTGGKDSKYSSPQEDRTPLEGEHCVEIQVVKRMEGEAN